MSPATGTRRLGYLNSEYPAVSHTFIQREIGRLRALGFDINVASVNSPRRTDAMTEVERAEIARTFYIKRAGFRRIAQAHLATIWRRPLAYLRGLFFALTMGGADLSAAIFGIFYFGEAVVLGYWAESADLRHLHVHFANAAATVALLTCRIFPITYSLTMHGPDELFDIKRMLLKEKVEAATFVCCIGYFARSQLLRVSAPEHWDKLVVAPLGVDPGVFTPAEKSAASEPFEFLCVGRLVPAKGQHLLLQAFEQLLRRGHRARLRLVGDGASRESLVAAVRVAGLGEHVIFTGAADQQQIRSYYRAADAFVLASFAEGIPVVLMEAMAAGLPCVATYVAGIPELIEDERSGLLVMPSDPDSLTTALERLLTDSALRSRLATAGRQRVCGKYDLDRNVHRLAAIFDERIVDLRGESRAPRRAFAPEHSVAR